MQTLIYKYIKQKQVSTNVMLAAAEARYYIYMNVYWTIIHPHF